MTRFLIALSLALGFAGAIPTPAHAYTDKQVTENYRSCQRFMKLSPALQAKVARAGGITVAQGRKACKLALSYSLKEVIRLEREYMAWERSQRRGGGSRADSNDSIGSAPTPMPEPAPDYQRSNYCGANPFQPGCYAYCASNPGAAECGQHYCPFNPGAPNCHTP